MVSHFGDYDTTETVCIPFNTFDSNDPSASVTVTNLAAGDVHIHKDGSATQRTTSTGVTVSIDFDSITGNHLVQIDLSDNGDAGFYAAGSRYQVRVEGITVDAATLNSWIGTFSIGCTLRPTVDGRTLDVTSTGTAGVDWSNVENQSTSVNFSNTNVQTVNTVSGNVSGNVSGSVGSINGVTFPTNFGDLSITTTTGLVDVTDKSGFSLSAAGVDAILDEALAGHTTAGTLGKAISDIETDAAAILVDTAEIGAAGAGLTAVPWNASWDAEVQSEVNDGLVAYNAVATTDLPTNFSSLSITTTTGLVDVNDKTGFALSASGVDAILDEAITEPAGVITWPTTLRAAMGWLAALARNKQTQTSSTTTLRNDADSANLATSTVTDDGTTFTRGEWS